jgi:hypothetical protein
MFALLLPFGDASRAQNRGEPADKDENEEGLESAPVGIG